jgi:hypothetical protein
MKAGAALLAAALALAACSGADKPAPQSPRIDGMLTTLYRPYSRDPAASSAIADWDMPVFSAATARLIAQWKQGFSDDQVLDLQDFGWFCECQDWDPKVYRLTIEPHGEPTGDRADVSVRLVIDADGERRSRLRLVRENGAWRVDDLSSKSFPHGLKAALRDDVRGNLSDPV